MSSVTGTHGTRSTLRYLHEAMARVWSGFSATLQRADHVMLTAGVTTSPVERSGLVVLPVIDAKHAGQRQRARPA